MKFFWKYIFPPAYGLLVYLTIRLLHDVDTGTQFWKRTWALNAIEIVCSLLTGYLCVWLFGRLFIYYDKRWKRTFSYKVVIRELGILIASNLLLVNIIFTPMAALTDDGLSWADFVDICMIPTLYAVIYYGVARSSVYMKAYVENKIQLEKTANDLLQIELKFLKSQYHPHFLFNALNTIYFQMDEDVQGAKKSVEKFSELLRYQLYDQRQQVQVKNEIEYLQNFIDLQKIRSSDKLQIEVLFDPDLNGQLVYPLLFLPLVENAFKFIGGDYKMTIDAYVADNQVVFRVENSVPALKQPASGGGIGIENLKRRLFLLYPQKHSLHLSNGNDTFIAELQLEYEPYLLHHH